MGEAAWIDGLPEPDFPVIKVRPGSGPARRSFKLSSEKAKYNTSEGLAGVSDSWAAAVERKVGSRIGSPYLRRKHFPDCEENEMLANVNSLPKGFWFGMTKRSSLEKQFFEEADDSDDSSSDEFTPVRLGAISKGSNLVVGRVESPIGDRGSKLAVGSKGSW